MNRLVTQKHAMELAKVLAVHNETSTEEFSKLLEVVIDDCFAHGLDNFPGVTEAILKFCNDDPNMAGFIMEIFKKGFKIGTGTGINLMMMVWAAQEDGGKDEW